MKNLLSSYRYLKLQITQVSLSSSPLDSHLPMFPPSGVFILQLLQQCPPAVLAPLGCWEAVGLSRVSDLHKCFSGPVVLFPHIHPWLQLFQSTSLKPWLLLIVYFSSLR